MSNDLAARGSTSLSALSTRSRSQLDSNQDYYLRSRLDSRSTSKRRASSSKDFKYLFSSSSRSALQGLSYNQGSRYNTIGNTPNSAINLGNLSGKSEYARYDTVTATSNPKDYYKFTLTKSSKFRLGLTKLSSNADLRLLDADGDQISRSGKGGTSNESIRKSLRAGTYYIEVAASSSSANYTLNLKGSGSASDAGSAPTEAVDAGNLTKTKRQYRGSVGKRGDSADVYRIELSQAGDLNLLVRGLSNDADLALLNSSGTQIARSSNDGKVGESINRQLSAGTYFVQVSAFNSRSTASYTLEMSSNYTGPSNSDDGSNSPSPSPSPSPAPSSSGRPGNSLRTAQSVSSATFSRRNQVNGGKSDFYRFRVNESGIFSAKLDGLSADADLRLIQDRNGNGSIDQGEVLGWQWEVGTRSESIRRFLNAGNYFVQVVGWKTGNYNVSTNFNASGGESRKFSIELSYKDGLQGLNSTVRSALTDAARFWERVIPYSTFNGAHTLNIDVVGMSSSERWLAAATNTSGQTDTKGNWMPVTGNVRVNTSYTDTYNKNPEYLRDIIIHEFGHVLGIGTLWSKNGRNLIDRNSGTYAANTYAGVAYGELLGSGRATAIPVERQYYGHWDENKFSSELLTPYAQRPGEKMPLSQLTIASLRDLGWNVNYGAAQNYSLSQAIKPASENRSAKAKTPKGYMPCQCPLCAGAKTALGLDLTGTSKLADTVKSNATRSNKRNGSTSNSKTQTA